jgi:hypothetical protein
VSTDHDPAAPLRALIRENHAAVQHLRENAIPHQIGMAAACRALSLDLPRVLSQQLEADIVNGTFAERWRASQAAAAAAAGDFDPLLGAVALVVKEHVYAAARHVVTRGKAWAAEAYRLQGQAEALETQTTQLARLLSPDNELETVAAAAALDPSTTAAFTEPGAAQIEAPLGGQRV